MTEMKKMTYTTPSIEAFTMETTNKLLSNSPNTYQIGGEDTPEMGGSHAGEGDGDDAAAKGSSGLWDDFGDFNNDNDNDD